MKKPASATGQGASSLLYRQTQTALSPLSSLPLVAMSLGYEIVVGVLLFVGHSVSTGELPVNGFPTDADFNWRLGREGLELRPAVKTDLPGATPRMLISTIAV